MSKSQPGPRLVERFIAVCFLTITLAVVLISTFQRLDKESLPRIIEIAFPENRLVQATSENPAAPKALLRAGVTTLVRIPYTLDDMLRYKLAEAWHPKPDMLEIRLADNKLTGNATIYLTGQFGMDALQIRLREEENICDVRLPRPIAKIEPNRFVLEIPTGPMPPGFRRALLLPAGDWGRTENLNQFTQAIYSLQPDLVIPYWQGGINAGYFFRSYFNTPWLRKPAVVIPEFSLPRAGRSVVRKQSKRQLFRGHYVPKQVAVKYTPQKLRQRILRAVKERSVSLVCVEPPKFWTFTQTLEFYQALRQDLLQGGFFIGSLQKPIWSQSGQITMILIYFGLGAILFFFIWQSALWAVGFTGREEEVDRVLTIRLRPLYFRWMVFFFCLCLLIIHWEGSAAWGGKIAAWCMAVLVPLLTLMLFVPARPGQEQTWLAAWGKSLKEFGAILLWNFMAALTIGVLLYHPDFIQRFDVFIGVKAAYLVPIFIGAIYLFPAITDKQWWEVRFSAGYRLWTVTAMLGIILFSLMLLIRSGNTAWFPIAAWETGAREQLEIIFSARPRFKEFFIGHPLLLAGLFARHLPGRSGRVWPEACVLLGLLGQVSMINTFCHIHTPLAVSLMRTWHGLWIGLLGGTVLTLIIRSIVRHRRIS